MGEDGDEKVWEQEFRARLREVRGVRSQQDMADILKIGRDAWNKYENRDARAVPIRLLPTIAKIGGKPLEWLIEGKLPVDKAKAQRKRSKAA